MSQSLKTVNVITLFVEDLRRAKEFYGRVFEVDQVDEDETTTILKFDNLFCDFRRARRPRKSSGGYP
jgi:predicted enzyme related to lactoylglutathione lyase